MIGTRVFRVDQTLLNQLLSVYQQEIFYLGKAYANDVLYPMWFKHFGSGPGGAGEAYHLGVFGKTGSGKSGLAKMMLCAYARHPQLGILVIDPQGEFSLELSGTRVGQQGLRLDQVIQSQGRPIHVYRISDIQLDDWTTFEEMLISLRFFEQLQIPSASPENARRAAEVVRNALEGTHNLDALGTLPVLQAALNAVNDPKTPVSSTPPGNVSNSYSNVCSDFSPISRHKTNYLPIPGNRSANSFRGGTIDNGFTVMGSSLASSTASSDRLAAIHLARSS
jgi:hypothetical protein